MMIDCGCGANHWPSTLLLESGISPDKPAEIPGEERSYGIDNLVITHPHGDHIADIKRIHENVRFFLLTGGYRPFIDSIAIDKIDFRRRGQEAATHFVEIVKKYCGTYNKTTDRVAAATPDCTVRKHRFIDYEDGMDLNELSWFVSLEIGGHKVLFTGDMTAAGIRKILKSSKAQKFAEFVKGTTVLRVPHHGRENGCSDELFELIGEKPLACVVSDEALNQRNENTSSVPWYHARTSDSYVLVNGARESRRVLTTRNDGDIFLRITKDGFLEFQTHALAEKRKQIYESP